MGTKKETRPVEGERAALFAEQLTGLDTILSDSPGRSKAEALVAWWDSKFDRIYLGDGLEDALGLFWFDHRVASKEPGCPRLEITAVLVELALAFHELGRRSEFLLFADEADRRSGDKPPMSVRVQLAQLLELATESAKTPVPLRSAERLEHASGSTSRRTIHTQDGRLLSEPRRILEALPGSKWEAIANVAGLDHDTVRKWSKPLQDAGLIKQSKDGWARLSAGDLALENSV